MVVFLESVSNQTLRVIHRENGPSCVTLTRHKLRVETVRYPSAVLLHAFYVRPICSGAGNCFSPNGGATMPVIHHQSRSTRYLRDKRHSLQMRTTKTFARELPGNGGTGGASRVHSNKAGLM